MTKIITLDKVLLSDICRIIDDVKVLQLPLTLH